MATVLIVDDELDVRMLVRFVFGQANDGLEVVAEAGDGDEAIELWRALEGPSVPDVVILDNRMPRLSGIETAEKILAERPDQIIVLYSALLDDAVRQQASEVGIQACVAKSDLDTLPALARRLVAERR